MDAEEQRQQAKKNHASLKERYRKTREWARNNIIFINSFLTAFYSLITLIAVVVALVVYFENKSEFANRNEPILQTLWAVAVSNWQSIGQNPIITVQIENYSDRSIHIDSAMLGFRFDSTDVKNIFTDRDTNISMNYDEVYVSAQHPYWNEKFTSKEKTTAFNISEFYCDRNTVFGVIYYTNYLTGKPRYYIFSVTISPLNYSPSGGARVVKIHRSFNTDELPEPYEKCRKRIFNK